MKREWKSGPPPHIGWWNASLSYSINVWRWWDGTRWSIPVGHTTPAHVAALRAKQASVRSCQKLIRWTNYYPENARVERKAP